MMSSTRFLIEDQLETMYSFIDADSSLCESADIPYPGFDYDEGYRTIASRVGCSVEDVLAVVNGNDPDLHDLPF